MDPLTGTIRKNPFMSKFLIIGILLLSFIAITGTAVAYMISTVPAKPPHYHANFAVFIMGVQENFSKPSLMTIQPCTDEVHHSDNPLENVHLHDQVGNVVHLHMDGITWKQFFESINFNLEQEVQKNQSTPSGLIISYYSNEEKKDHSILDQVIQPQERLLIDVSTQSAAIASTDPRIVTEYEKVGNSAKDFDEGKIGIEQCGSGYTRSLWQRFKLSLGMH